MEVYETDISGSLTPRSTRAFSLALKQAIRIDSVPPLVVTPAAPFGALNIANTIATISASIFRTPGKTSGCIGFATLNFSKASACNLIRSSPPWYTAPLTRPSSQRVCSMSPNFWSSARTCCSVHASLGRVRYRLMPGPLGTSFPSSFAIASATCAWTLLRTPGARRNIPYSVRRTDTYVSITVPRSPRPLSCRAALRVHLSRKKKNMRLRRLDIEVSKLLQCSSGVSYASVPRMR